MFMFVCMHICVCLCENVCNTVVWILPQNDEQTSWLVQPQTSVYFSQHLANKHFIFRIFAQGMYILTGLLTTAKDAVWHRQM